MNWKEHPHLFANGKFRVRLNDYYHNAIVGPIWYVPDTTGFVDRFEFPYRSDIQADMAPINKCQLIARPIEDMTDEELTEICGVIVKEKERGFALNAVDYQRKETETFLFLLSIGVYPFDQDDEDVIFKPKQ